MSAASVDQTEVDLSPQALEANEWSSASHGEGLKVNDGCSGSGTMSPGSEVGSEENLLAKDYQSNLKILVVTTTLFMAFVFAEIIGALASNSLSLLGDAAAMSVDVFTYGSNMYAERLKSQGRGESERDRMILEVYVPMFSISALLGVTIYILSDAVHTIRNPPAAGVVDVNFLYGFSSANFVIDVVSTYLFYRKGKSAFISEIHHTHTFHTDRFHLSSAQVPLNPDDCGHPFSGKNELPEAKKNLNMISAFTHLGADSMRTLSVFIAAVIVTTRGYSADICDAWAAIIVSGTIFFMVIPLLSEVYKAAFRDT